MGVVGGQPSDSEKAPLSNHGQLLDATATDTSTSIDRILAFANTAALFECPLSHSP